MTDQEIWNKIREEKEVKRKQAAAVKPFHVMAREQMEPPAWAQKIQKQGGNILL